ncbi:hypothetical protein GQ54DRAFT_305576 [Martensiomyces pterosporus]|nr:hypothetical protein GQ54DRAFT_305576 [Martensiomyces pterosporus]
MFPGWLVHTGQMATHLMAAESLGATRVLGRNVHARLLIKHVLLAKEQTNTNSHNGAQPLGHSSQLLRLRDSTNNTTHSLVFDFVKISGTAVGQQTVEIEGKTRELVYIDDGTGVLPFTLCAGKESSDEDAMADKEMRTRLSQAKDASGSYSGRTIGVRGVIRRASPSIAPGSSPGGAGGSDIPPIWIECRQLVVQRDPMSEVVALVETLNIYRCYFPSHSLLGRSSPELDRVNDTGSQSMRAFLRLQSTQAASMTPPKGSAISADMNNAASWTSKRVTEFSPSNKMLNGTIAASGALQISPHVPSSKRARIMHGSPVLQQNRAFGLLLPSDLPSSPTGRIRKAPRTEAPLLSSDPFGNMNIDEDQLLDVLNDLDVLPSEVPEVRALLTERPNGATREELGAVIQALGNDPDDVIEEMQISAVIFKKGSRYFLV